VSLGKICSGDKRKRERARKRFRLWLKHSRANSGCSMIRALTTDRPWNRLHRGTAAHFEAGRKLRASLDRNGDLVRLQCRHLRRLGRELSLCSNARYLHQPRHNLRMRRWGFDNILFVEVVTRLQGSWRNSKRGQGRGGAGLAPKAVERNQLGKFHLNFFPANFS
jgi:hypothetical protein